MNVMTNQPLSDSLYDERQAFAELARDLAMKKLVENIEAHDSYPFGELFTGAIEDAGTVGFYGINLPSDFGGVDMNTAMIAVILEQLARYDASLAGVVFTNAAALEIIRSASVDVDCAGIYEGIPSTGTAPLAFPACTSPDETEMPVAGAGGLITGTVRYLVLGGIAGHAVIPAVKEGAPGFSWYLVRLDDAGVSRSGPVVSLGFHACPAVDVTLHESKGILIGLEGEGGKYFSAMEEAMSLCAAALSLGLMKGSLQSALEYTADRYQGGRQIIDWPQVRMMLANMAIEMKSGEAILYRACQECDNEVQGWGYTARAAAIHIGELATRTCTDGVQLFGGNGYMKDYPQEKRFRDARQAQCLLGMAALKKIRYIDNFISDNR